MMSRDFVISQKNRRLTSLGSGAVALTSVFSTSNVSGTVTTGTSTTIFIDTGLGTVNTYLGRIVRFKPDTATVALRNVVRFVSVYTVSTSSFTVSPALPATPAIGDTFEILSEMQADSQFLLLGATYNIDATTAAGLAINFKLSQPNGQKYLSRICGSSAAATQQWFGNPPVSFNMSDGDITLVLTPVNATWNAIYETSFLWCCIGRSS